MAGHSKWANIKHRKAKADAAKGKVFSRLIKEIISAVKQGGTDPKNNSRLRLVIDKAKAANLPSDTIERNIKKATHQDQSDYHEMLYELYGYGGVGILCEVMTDNKNRIASDMRIAINKQGGTIASPGAVAFNFEHKGVIQILKSNSDEEALFLEMTEAGAEDVETTEELFVVTTSPELLYKIKEKLDALHIPLEEVSLERIPKHFIQCSSEEQSLNLALIEYLENLDDVDVVYHNMKI